MYNRSSPTWLNVLYLDVTFTLQFCLSGGFAIAAGKRRTPCLITAHMVLAIIASLSAISLVFKSAGSIGMAAWELRDNDPMYYDMVYPVSRSLP
jgi:hypothetical protein